MNYKSIFFCLVLIGFTGAAFIHSPAQTAAPTAPAKNGKSRPLTADSTQSSAGSSQMDQRLAKALKIIGYKYEEMKEGVAKLYFNLTDGRSHQVFIASKTQKVGPYETRKIWATAMKTQDLPERQLANRLLMENDRQPFGSWVLVKWPDGYRVLFVVPVPAELPPDQLKVVIQIVLGKADTMENELTKEDRF